MRHARELAGQALAAPRLDDLADRQGVDDHVGGELPVAGPRGVAHRVGERPVPLIPPGRPPVQDGDPVRILAPQLQEQHLSEQRVVAVPPAPGWLDKRVRPRHRQQDPAGPLVTGQLAGDLGADPLQDGALAVSQDNASAVLSTPPDQVAGSAVLSDQLGDELVRVGMSTTQDRVARAPAPSPPSAPSGTPASADSGCQRQAHAHSAGLFPS